MAYGKTLLSGRRMFGLAAACIIGSVFAAEHGNATDFYTDFCESCFSDSQFASAAIQTAPDVAPESGAVITYPVYVTNPNSLEVRFFDVLVWYEWGDMNPYSQPDPDAAEISDYLVTQGPLNKSAVPGQGDPVVSDAHVDAVLTAEAFLATTADVSVGELPIPPGEGPDSAIDLVGSNGPTELARNTFRSRVQDYLESNLSSLLGQSSDLLERLFNNYVGQSSIFDSIYVDIEFTDGTTIRVKINGISNNPVAIEAEVLPNSARMPDGSSVPQNPGQFEGYDFTGPSGVGQSLLDLLDRYGITVPGGQPDCDFACTHNGNYLECTLTCRPH